MSSSLASEAKSLHTRLLGSSDLSVTEACLGTMTWGTQNSEAEAHAQLDYAVKERGVTMIDTAELYPVPTDADNWVAGTTEKYIGTWLAANPEWRSKLVLASKIVGYSKSSDTAAARTEPPTSPAPDSRLDRDSVRAACEASLRRLQTDYIDLYQIHWPDRYVPGFGTTEYRYENERADSVSIEETAAAIFELLKEGKIKNYGLSNESTFGVCEWMHVAAKLGMPPPVSIQNAFSLLCRGFETELAEACSPRNHNIGLLPWSILCGGLLSGKYFPEAGEAPPDPASRFVKYDQYMNRWHPKHAREATLAAAKAYKAIAARSGVTSSQLAVLFCRSRAYMAHGSIIVGGTSVEQLKETLDAFTVPVDKVLTEDVLAEIDAVHMRCRDPSNRL